MDCLKRRRARTNKKAAKKQTVPWRKRSYAERFRDVPVRPWGQDRAAGVEPEAEHRFDRR